DGSAGGSGERSICEAVLQEWRRAGAALRHVRPEICGKVHDCGHHREYTVLGPGHHNTADVLCTSDAVGTLRGPVAADRGERFSSGAECGGDPDGGCGAGTGNAGASSADTDESEPDNAEF